MMKPNKQPPPPPRPPDVFFPSQMHCCLQTQAALKRAVFGTVQQRSYWQWPHDGPRFLVLPHFVWWSIWASTCWARPMLWEQITGWHTRLSIWQLLWRKVPFRKTFQPTPSYLILFQVCLCLSGKKKKPHWVVNTANTSILHNFMSSRSSTDYYYYEKRTEFTGMSGLKQWHK